MDNATGETTQVWLWIQGNEIENYHDFVKVDEGYVLQGGDGTKVFSLHVSVLTYEADESGWIVLIIRRMTTVVFLIVQTKL